MAHQPSGDDVDKTAEEWIGEARIRLGLSWEELANRAGISPVTLRRARRGQPVRDFQIASLEEALGWTPGSYARVMRGDPPTMRAVMELLDQEDAPDLRDEAERDLWTALQPLTRIPHDQKVMLLQLRRAALLRQGDQPPKRAAST